MKNIRPLVLICSLLGATALQATTVIPPKFEELVDNAQLIFEGTVSEVKSEWAGEGAQRRIVSFVTFKVKDTLKGEAGSSYTMRMLGGTVDGQTLEVTDGPKFKVGDRDVVFVENNGSQFIPLVGIMHGRFRVELDKVTGREVVALNSGAPLTDVTALGQQDPTGHGAGRASVTGRPAVSLQEFKRYDQEHSCHRGRSPEEPGINRAPARCGPGRASPFLRAPGRPQLFVHLPGPGFMESRHAHRPHPNGTVQQDSHRRNPRGRHEEAECPKQFVHAG